MILNNHTFKINFPREEPLNLYSLIVPESLRSFGIGLETKRRWKDSNQVTVTSRCFSLLYLNQCDKTFTSVIFPVREKKLHF